MCSFHFHGEEHMPILIVVNRDPDIYLTSNTSANLKRSFSQLFNGISTPDWLFNAEQQLHKNTVSNIEQVLEATPHKAAAVRPPTTHHVNYPS